MRCRFGIGDVVLLDSFALHVDVCARWQAARMAGSTPVAELRRLAPVEREIGPRAPAGLFHLCCTEGLMAEIPTHRVRPMPPPRRYLDAAGFIRFGRPRSQVPPMHIGKNSVDRRRRLQFVQLVRALPAQHPSGYEDLRGACCGR